ncbi:MAG: energy transducer TonB [Nitrospinae bacterium]|nr:energy transducer TonB [Nitrospinota bacterium]
MKTDTIKISFVASILFHSIVIYIFTSHLSSLKNTAMNITPIEILNIEDKNIAGQKIEDTPPPLPEKAIQKIKEDTPPQVETIKPEINNIVEAPPLIQEVKEEILYAKREDTNEDTEEIISDEIASPSQNELFVKSGAEPSNNVSASSTETTTSSATASDSIGSNIESTFASLSVNSASPYGVAGGTGSGNGEEMSLFRAMVKTKIERAKFYPRWAREKGFEGVVGVRFVVHPDGGVSDVTIVRPCHCEILNKAACEAIMKAAPFNPRPVEVADKEMAMEVDISYRLD